MKQKFQNVSADYWWLDVARATAAFAVMAEHVRAFIFVDFGETSNQNWACKLFYFVTGLGHQAVVVFFVLSGFLVGGQVYALCSERRWSWSDYAIKRIGRLWTVLIPALILTALWDRLGMALTHSGLYTGMLNGVYHSTPTQEGTVDIYSPFSFLMNCLFVQTVQLPIVGTIPTFGTNGPLWSLANEAWYYLLFPLILLPLRSFRTPTASAAIMLTLGLLICVVLPQTMVLSGSLWLMGVALFLFNRYVNVSRRACAITALIAVPLFVGCLWRARTLGSTSLESDLSVGISFSILLGCLIRIESAPKFTAALSKKFADFSYTLYLTHFPLAAALACIVLNNQRLQPSLFADGIFCLATILLVVYAYVVYLLFERNTKNVQLAMKRRFSAWLPLSVGALKAGGEP